ncbi:hypothetical protein ACJZL1_05670 [Wolbachia endosymbiont of Rhagoletis indifferens]|uniref:hypothetical protein n=1 Tax=Wolbachia endosymbiont of Rhagoletis indifferens TaxID=3383250 RepID=UPI003AF3E95D
MTLWGAGLTIVIPLLVSGIYAKRYCGGMTVCGGMTISSSFRYVLAESMLRDTANESRCDGSRRYSDSSSRYVLEDEIPRRYDVESALAITQHFYTHQISLLAYKQTFLDPSSQGTGMTSFLVPYITTFVQLRFRLGTDALLPIPSYQSLQGFQQLQSRHSA